MATRSLTDIFTLMRNNASHNRAVFLEQTADDRMALVESGEFMEMHGGGIPPSWLHIMEEARYYLTRIGKKLKDLKALQQAVILKPTLDDSKPQELQIETFTKEITKLLSTSHRLIHRIRQDSLEEMGGVDSKIAQNVTNSLFSLLRDLSTEFRHAENVYMDGLKSREERSNIFKDVDMLGLGGEDLQNLDERVDREFELGPNFSPRQKQMLLEEEENERMALQRSEEVNKIVNSLADLNYIFKDLGQMIMDQGTVLDRIDYNIEQSQCQVRQAYQELEKADRYHRRNRKLQCILIMAPVTLVLFLLLIVVKF